MRFGLSRHAFAVTCVILGIAPTATAVDVIQVGAKSFTEQQILGEIVAQLLERHTDLKVERRFGLGGTGLCHSALVSGDLDIYVEYTGTASMDVLRAPADRDALSTFRNVSRAYRQQFDLTVMPPVGFNNTYAMTVREQDAGENGWERISDLAEAAESLRCGFTSEFVERPDGYPGLRRAYGIDFGEVSDVDPGLMYDALRDGQVDVICAFATDGRLASYPFRVLEDDRLFFPPYDAVPVVRGETLRRHPEIREALAALMRSIDASAMRRMNHSVDVDRLSPNAVAKAWIERNEQGSNSGLADSAAAPPPPRPRTMARLIQRRWAEIGRKTVQHLILTGLAMGFAMTVGIPLGILIHHFPRSAGGVLGLTEVVQTVPSLAMLAFLFAVYRTLGIAPAVTALVLYALLPIVLNTYTGLRQVPAEVKEAAVGVGMSPSQRLCWVELPLALPVIMAGIRTATVWTVGIATLSTYVGAGGLGDFISRGLARNDPALTLLGAVPAGLMAIVLSLVLRWVERRLRARTGLGSA